MRTFAGLAALFLSVATPALAELGPVQDGAARWVTLGTSGGPAVRTERAQIANALVMPGGEIYLFDVGNGVQRQMARAGLSERAVRAVFLSHHHLDHVADLGPILWTHWTFGEGKLTVVGPVGTRQLVNGLVSASAPITLAGYPTAGPAKTPLAEMIEVVEIPADLAEPFEAYRDERMTVEAVGTDHYQTPPSVTLAAMPQALAFRISTPGRAIAYTGDSGPSPRLASLVSGVDLLVSEVVELEAITAQLERDMEGAPEAVRQGIIDGMRVNHLTPAEVGRMAGEGEVGTVLLTHFVPSPEVVTDRSIYAREIAENFTGEVILADDLGSY